MAHDPVTGPLTRSELKEAVEAPFGGAKKIIRRHDPTWGLAEGEKIEFVVSAEGHLTGTAIVKASSEEEANELAEDLDCNAFDWDATNDFEIISVEPYVRQHR